MSYKSGKKKDENKGNLITKETANFIIDKHMNEIIYMISIMIDYSNQLFKY